MLARMSDAMTLLADRMFDGVDLVEGPHLVEVERGVITSVRPVASGSALPAGLLDTRGGTLLPGLIDAHCHLARVGLFEPHEAPNPAAVAHNLRSALGAGVTTAGDMGCTIAMIQSLRERTGAEVESGPSIRAAGPLLTAPLGYPLDWMSPAHVWLGAAIPCADQRSARRAVQRLAEAGMDHVKICIMHRGYDLEPLPVFSKKVARAIVEEAHALGMRALAHAHWNADYRVALAAGVDARMHSAFDPLDEDPGRRVRDAGVGVCPTLWVFHSACLGAEARLDRDPSRLARAAAPVRRSWRRFADAYAASGDVLPAGIAGGLAKSAARRGVTNAMANLRLLREAGVPLAYGSDGPYGFSEVAHPLDELRTLAEAGLSPIECLRAATSGAAEVLGARGVGRIAPGARADLLWLDGDPTSDLEVLDRVRGVFRGGRRVDSVAGSSGVRAAAWRGLLGTLRHAAAMQRSH